MTEKSTGNATTRDWLAYYRASLADGDLIGLDSKKMDSAIPYEDFKEGRMNQQATDAVFAALPRQDQDKQFVELIFAPFRAALNASHGVASGAADRVVLVVYVPAVLARDGALMPARRLTPWMPREHLDPTPRPTVLGSLEAYDSFLTDSQCDPAEMTWAALLGYAAKMVQAVIGEKIESDMKITISGNPYHIDGKARFATATMLKGAGANILRLYDALLSTDKKADPLPELLTRILPSEPANHTGPLSLSGELDAALAHVGQMTARFPLSPSQRRTLHHFFVAQEEGSVLAVNGPPGTGKTTLLQSVIASMVVHWALNQASHPPVIVAASTNNQAVTNIIKSFATTADATDPLSMRWLPEINSFGLYCPSESRLTRDESIKRFQCCATARDGSVIGFPSQIETPEYQARAEKAFLENWLTCAEAQGGLFPDMPTIPAAKAAIHVALRTLANESLFDPVAGLCDLSMRVDAMRERLLQRERLQSAQEEAGRLYEEKTSQAEAAKNALENAEAVAAAFKRHVLSLPFWLALLTFLPPVKKNLALRNGVFLEPYGQAVKDLPIKSYAESYGIIAALDARVATARERSEQAGTEAMSAKASLGRITEDLVSLDSDIESVIEDLVKFDPQPISRPLTAETAPILHTETVYAALEALDTKVRGRLWWLAVHYFEACWLIERREDLESGYKESQAPNKQARRWRRYAKLTPCIVTTLHMAPRVFSGYAGKYEPLYEAIDLLILDESGQVAPQVAIPAFALGKRALIVGDTYQIEPVWAVPEGVDAANLIAFGILKEPKNGGKLAHLPEETGLRPFSASCGNLMALAQLATPYALPGFAEPGMHLTEHRRCATPIIEYCKALVYPNLQPLTPSREAPLPHFGYAHIAGASQKLGGSRANFTEAETLAEWLSRRAPELTAHYGRPLGDIVAVVTPFAGQVATIRESLEKYEIEGVTVGTVHCLQGAERSVVIFSPTVTSADPGPYFFDRGPNMLNVAVSRAKDSFLVFGDMTAFDPSIPSRPSGLLADFLFSLHPAEIVDVTPPRRAFSVETEVRTLTCKDEHVAELAEAFRIATSSIIIVSPFLAVAALQADSITSQISQVVAQNVAVDVFTDPEFNKDSKNSIKFESYLEAVRMLRDAGATVTECDRIHSKTLMVDTIRLIEGSFNWLSACRDDSWARYERSIVYTAANLSDARKKLMDTLKVYTIRH
ncbi:MAG TPA: AAA domain-containing protein [Solidesulfovibrio magneticus]|nr:AAA domain-containing protein [Solidesulfovibrio magneticus]